MGILTIYLFLYNLIQFGGWSTLLFWTAKKILNGDTQGGWGDIQDLLTIFQFGALFEVAHVMFGLVKTPLFTTLIQVGSRIWIVGLTIAIPTTMNYWAFPMMLMSWCMTEVVRYLYYALNTFDSVPYILKWMRYSLFLILYPSGVAGELGVMYASLPVLKAVNEGYYYGVIALMLAYLPGLPTMYGHMMKQRRRYLSGSPEPVQKQTKKKTS